MPEKIHTVLRLHGLEVIRLELGPYGNNAYVLKDMLQKRALLIDAPWDPGRLLWGLAGLNLTAILLTHAHPDHIMALQEVRKATGAPVGLNPSEPGAGELSPELALEDGQELPIGELHLEVRHTPGHTPGSSTFVLDGLAAFCGDTVFPGGPGRTWSPEGFQSLINSLEEKIFTLPPGTLLLPGHGEGITVRDSLSEYRRFLSKGPKPGLWGEVRWEEP